jgi:hypothetical protein
MRVFKRFNLHFDRLYGLVVIVPGCRSRGPGFVSRRYQIIWEVVGPEQGPLSLVSTIEELLVRKSSGSGLENREVLALTSPTSGSHSVDIVHSRTKAMEIVLLFVNVNFLKLRFTYNYTSNIRINLVFLNTRTTHGIWHRVIRWKLTDVSE